MSFAFLLLCLTSAVRADGLVAGEESIVSLSSEKLQTLEALHTEAERLIALGRMREAVEIYWQVVLLEPDDDAAYTGLGHLYLVLSDISQAEDAFKNALHIDPDNEDAAIGLYQIAHPDSF